MNYDLLYTMLNTESVSGGEIPLQKKVAAYMREAGFNVDTDKTGNVIAHINEESAVKVLMSGHIDEIGFRVTYISENGMIHVNKAGYIRPELMQGKRVTVLGKKRITGVMGILLKDGNVRTDVALKDMYIDCGFTTDKQAAEWIKPGDFVTYTYAYDMLENNCIAGRGLDDKLGAFTVMQALMRAKELNARAGVYAAATVGEETGMRGCESEAEAEMMLMQSGEEVLRTAEDTLKKCGMEYGAQLIIGEFEFPDRVYAGILYPKGKYRALRIILGEGKGHNWWCVMFPAICIDAGEKGEIDIKGLEMKSWIIEKLKSIDGGKLWEKIMRRLG